LSMPACAMHNDLLGSGPLYFPAYSNKQAAIEENMYETTTPINVPCRLAVLEKAKMQRRTGRRIWPEMMCSVKYMERRVGPRAPTCAVSMPVGKETRSVGEALWTYRHDYERGKIAGIVECFPNFVQGCQVEKKKNK
jgi:hypothetical protein